MFYAALAIASMTLFAFAVGWAVQIMLTKS